MTLGGSARIARHGWAGPERGNLGGAGSGVPELRQAAAEDSLIAAGIARAALDPSVDELDEPWRTGLRMHIAEAAIRRRLGAGRIGLVAFRDDEPAGYAELCLGGAGEPSHLELLAVHPAAQGRGLGRHLVERVRARLLEARPDAEALTAGAWPEALGFYHRLGFVPEVGETDMSGLRRVRLSLR